MSTAQNPYVAKRHAAKAAKSPRNKASIDPAPTPPGFLADAPMALRKKAVATDAAPVATPQPVAVASNRATPIKVELLYPAPDGRSVQKDVVLTLCDSIKRIGLHSPLTVRPVRKVRDGARVDAFEIVTGRHRYEACLRLGMAEIECFVDTGDAAQSRLWYLAENLHRAELTDDERRQHIAEWVRLMAEKDVQSPHGAANESKRADGKGHRQEEAISKAAKELGISKDTAARAVRAESLPDEAKAIADEAGLGTVARAKAAAADDPVEAVKKLVSQKVPADETKKRIDRAIKSLEALTRNEALAAIADYLGVDVEVVCGVAQ